MLNETGGGGDHDKDCEALIRDGYVVFRGVLARDELDSIISAIERIPNDEWKYQAEGVSVVGEALILPSILELVDRQPMIGVVNSLFIQHATLLSATIRRLEAGALAQNLHVDYPRDWPLHAPLGTKWTLYPTLVVAVYPSGLDSDLGPLFLVPGSHRKQSHPKGSPPEEPITLNPGDILLFDGAVWHRGGGNSDERRVRYGIFLDFSLSWVRRPKPLRAPSLRGLRASQRQLLSDLIRPEHVL